MDDDELKRLRDAIDAVDHGLLEALARRRELTQEVIETKDSKGLELRDQAREEELLAQRIRDGRGRGLDAHYVTRIFQEIIDDSVRSQHQYLISHYNADRVPLRRVAFQGIEGAYSHLAARKYFSKELDQTTFQGYSTFVEVVDAVEEGRADCAFLPIENTTAGSINEVYDLLSRASLAIVGEEIFPVDHCLLGLPGATLSGLRRILSHPMAIAQCMKYLSNLPGCLPEPYADTAMAVRKVADDGDPTQGAIASEQAGQNYGLVVLKRHLADQRDNYTRFLIAALEPIQVDRRIPAKTSLILAVPDEEGALLKALAIFHEAKINLTKLESRPRPGMAFQYNFYVDFEGNLDEARVKSALRKIRGVTSSLKVLGCYPIERRSRTAPKIASRVPRATVPPDPPSDAAAESDSTSTAEEPAAAGAGEDHGLASRATKPEDTVVNVRGVKIGGPEFVVIAGPGYVESREQIFACARQVKECGGSLLRGGCFRPRTGPGEFEGLGLEGLALLERAGKEYDLPVAAEVASPADVEVVARHADLLVVGSRNMQNQSLLAALGRVHKPVLLKRGIVATIDELIAAAELIIEHGNHEVILCERGIRTFETSSRDTLDLSALPLIKARTHLPIIVDPTRAAASRELIAPLSLAARALAPHGLMVELHPDPDHALADGDQALKFDAFADLMGKIYAED